MEALGADLEQGDAEGLHQGLGQAAGGREADASGQEQRGLLLDGGVLVVHHRQDVFTHALERGL